MRRDPRSFLWDVQDAAGAIRQFLQQRDFDAYMTDLMLRSAVERQLATIGEALTQLRRLDPELAARIPELRGVIAFRNNLIHGYSQIDDYEVWRAIEHDLPALCARVTALLAELGDAP